MNEREAVERHLSEELHRRLLISIRAILTENKRTMISWRVVDGSLHVRLHRIFASAPTAVLDAVAGMISSKRRDDVITDFIESNRAEISPRRRKGVIRSRGRWHDLEQILADLNERYLENRFEGDITWGRRAPKRQRRTILLGSYHPDECLIRIHPSLDQDFVPRYVVEWIVFHEMLHQLVEMPLSGSRRRCHTPQFRALEASYPDHERAREWESGNLSRLLRS